MGIMRSDRHDLIANYDNSGMKLLRDQDVGTTAGMTMATQEKRNCNLIVDFRCVSVEDGKESKTHKDIIKAPLCEGEADREHS